MRKLLCSDAASSNLISGELFLEPRRERGGYSQLFTLAAGPERRRTKAERDGA
jgi:hypothetical protein